MNRDSTTGYCLATLRVATNVRSDCSRRRFLKGIGSAAAAASFPDLLRVVTAEPTQQSADRPTAIVFWEDDFPQVDGCNIDRSLLQTALEHFDVRYLPEQALIDQLRVDRCHLLITPYGSAFPRRAWPAVLKYLRAGGNLLNLGGAPFSAPATRAGSQWRIENRQTAYHKKLGITQSFPIAVGKIASYQPANHFAQDNPKSAGRENFADQFKPDEIYELYVRFSSSNLIPDESGSDGPREAALYPLVFGMNGGMNREQRPLAAPVIQIDRLQGEFAGGRWLLANFRGRISAAAIRALAELAVQGAFEFRVRSDWACYRAGETPQFTVDLRRPRGGLEKLINESCRVEVRAGGGQVVAELAIALKSEGSRAVGNGKLRDATKLVPGLYRIDARVTVSGGSTHELRYSSGFWVFDQQLLTSGKPLTVDDNSFFRNGDVFPVTGTTYMASDVHRQFLFEPNPFVWDQDFRAMKAAGVNLVRTGIWTGWKKFMSEPGKLNEAALRALDAFLLTAHRHDIPVIFTFFAFLPETWGGKNAYLDPQAVRAQSQFVSAFAQRYRDVDDLIWDLINEPSFCSPKHLWSCRPNYDEYELKNWQQWLRRRYAALSDEELATRLQELWKTTDETALDLPRLQDFESPNILDDRRPLKTLDYRIFAQEMFEYWVQVMSDEIHKNGNKKQLITVGQDEGGLGDSPNPHFFASSVDFTCMHNWWANDDLVWDSVMAKTPGTPSLIEETGIMFYEKMDGSAWRTEEEARNLLERKLAISFAAQGAGFVQWIWNANCYMNSDNEAAIGFYRADQTAKPELDSFLKITRFIAKHRNAFRAPEAENAVMLIPHSQMFSPRSFTTEATRRCVRAMFYHCRMPLRTMSEYNLRKIGPDARVILVPSPRMLTEECWQALVKVAAGGATVAISGAFDADEHWQTVAARYREIFSLTAETLPVSESESLMIGNREYVVRYEGEKIQRVDKALVKAKGPARALVLPHGAGRFVWSPLPLEVSSSIDALVAFYRFALAQAHISSGFSLWPDTPSVLALPSIFEKEVLYTLVSESGRDTAVTLMHRATRTRVPLTVPAGRTALVLLDRLTGKVIDSTR
jgi:hypothetical protein